MHIEEQKQLEFVSGTQEELKYEEQIEICLAKTSDDQKDMLIETKLEEPTQMINSSPHASQSSGGNGSGSGTDS